MACQLHTLIWCPSRMNPSKYFVLIDLNKHKRFPFGNQGVLAILLDLNDNHTLIGELTDTLQTDITISTYMQLTRTSTSLQFTSYQTERVILGTPLKVQTLPKTIRSKNNFPIIVTGDFNENLNQPCDLTFLPGLKEMTTLDHFYSTHDLRVQWMIIYTYQMCLRATVSLSAPKQELLHEGVSPRATVLVEGLTNWPLPALHIS